MKMIATFALLSLSPLLLCADPATDSAGSNAPVEIGHGINFGNFLEAPPGSSWGRALTDDDFSQVKQAGFTTVRVPICWSGYLLNDGKFTIDPSFLAKIDWVVAEAKKYGLNAILDYHNDGTLMDDPDGQADRYLATWKQISEHFKDAPPSILFELLNEPNHKLDAPHWNALLAKALAIVRVDNPHRAVVIGPVHSNNPDYLKDLVLPEDDRDIIVTFHYYRPMKFTHQGASWVHDPAAKTWINVAWNGTPAETQPIVSDFDKAAAWGQEHHLPLYLGEFGAFLKGPMDSRARWIAFVARTAEARGFTWTYWEFSSGFGVFDPAARQWHEPLLKALLPQSPLLQHLP
jgi:endoglucanase